MARAVHGEASDPGSLKQQVQPDSELSAEDDAEQGNTEPDSDDIYNREVLLRLAVSYYLSVGLSQKEIAQVLRRSESVVSRAVSDAKKKGWLKISYDISGIPREYERLLPLCLSVPKLANEIMKKFPLIQMCTVVPKPGFFEKEIGPSHQSEEPDAADRKSKTFGFFIKAAANRMVDILRSCPDQIVLVSWGYTVNSLLENITFPVLARSNEKGSRSYGKLAHTKSSSAKSSAAPSMRAHSERHSRKPAPNEKRPCFDRLEIFPILGNFSISHMPSPNIDLSEDKLKEAFQIFIKYSANANARILSSRCGQGLPPRPLLTVALLDVSLDELQLCKPVFLADHTLMDLYGKFWNSEDRTGKIWQADTLITSIGTSEYPEAFVYRALGYDVGGRGRRFAGDICGVLFDDKCNPVKFDRGQLIGPRLEHILHIAERHRKLMDDDRKPGGAGVVVVAAGEEKVPPLFYLAQNGFINELIITEETAQLLLSH